MVTGRLCVYMVGGVSVQWTTDRMLKGVCKPELPQRKLFDQLSIWATLISCRKPSMIAWRSVGRLVWRSILGDYEQNPSFQDQIWTLDNTELLSCTVRVHTSSHTILLIMKQENNVFVRVRSQNRGCKRSCTPLHSNLELHCSSYPSPAHDHGLFLAKDSTEWSSPGIKGHPNLDLSPTSNHEARRPLRAWSWCSLVLKSNLPDYKPCHLSSTQNVVSCVLGSEIETYTCCPLFSLQHRSRSGTQLQWALGWRSTCFC